MSFYEDLKRKVDEEKAYKKATVIDNESKIVSVRPDSMIMSLIEIFSYVNGKAPAEYIATNFSVEFAKYLVNHGETVESINKILQSDDAENIEECDDYAIGILIENKFISENYNWGDILKIGK